MSDQGGSRLGLPRNPTGTPKKPRKPRKKVSQRKRVERPKRRGEHKAKQKEATLPDLPEIGVMDADLVECVFSDEEGREEFLEKLPELVSGSLGHPISPGSRVESPSTASLNFEDQSSAGLQPSEYSPQLGISLVSSELMSSTQESSKQASSEEASSSTAFEERLESVSNEGDFGNSDVPEPTSATSLSDTVASTSSDFPPPSPGTPVILQAVDKLRATLPSMWLPVGDKSGIHLYRLSPSVPKRAIQREIFIPYVGDEQIFVHCEPLPFAADILKSVKLPKINLNENTLADYCKRAVSLAQTLEQYSVCIGADILELKEVWGQISNAHVDRNPYQEVTYSETCRSNSCSKLIVLGRGKRCKNCSKLLRSLRQRRSFLLSASPHPSTPNTHLTYKQALEKLKAQHDEIKKKDLKIAYLEKRFRDILDRDGVDIDTDLSEDLANVLANSSSTTEQEIFLGNSLLALPKEMLGPTGGTPI